MTIEAPSPVDYYAPSPGGEEFISVQSRPRSRVSADFILRFVTGASAVTIILMLVALLVVLTLAAMPSIRAYGATFLVGTDWRPNVIERPLRGPDGKLVRDADGEIVMETLHESFGALNVIYGTTVSSAIALLFAVPVSLGAAVFLVRVASARFVAPVSFLIEFLAAIPSIAYGIWGLFVLAPLLQSHVEPFLQHWLKDVPGLSWMFWDAAEVAGKTVYRLRPLTGRDMFCGGMILAVMIIPIITAISRDVLRGVPRAQVEGTTALGATWWQSSKEMLKFSRSGLFGAIMLGLARAAGETMAVAMVIGNKNQIEFSPFAPAQTMSSLLANEFAEANGELHPAALTEVALILLVMSLVFNVVARWLVVGKGARTAAAH